MAEWVRASALSHSEWMVLSSNPGKGRNYVYSRVGDGGLNVTSIIGYRYLLLKINPNIEFKEIIQYTLSSLMDTHQQHIRNQH